jgi:hypothetical protein
MDFSISVLFICSLVTHLVTEFSAYLSLMVRGAKSRREWRGERAHASRLCTTRSSDRCGAITDSRRCFGLDARAGVAADARSRGCKLQGLLVKIWTMSQETSGVLYRLQLLLPSCSVALS